MNNGKIMWDPANHRIPKPDVYGNRTKIGRGNRGTYKWVEDRTGLWSAHFMAHRGRKWHELVSGVDAGTSYHACTEHNRPGMAGMGRGA